MRVIADLNSGWKLNKEEMDRLDAILREHWPPEIVDSLVRAYVNGRIEAHRRSMDAELHRIRTGGPVARRRDSAVG